MLSNGTIHALWSIRKPRPAIAIMDPITKSEGLAQMTVARFVQTFQACNDGVRIETRGVAPRYVVKAFQANLKEVY